MHGLYVADVPFVGVEYLYYMVSSAVIANLISSHVNALDNGLFALALLRP